MAAARRAEFEDWHSHEHFPERLRIPGFERGSRWASAGGGDGFFVMYELASYETLTSPAYLARLNDPTPWSLKMMPHHSNMIRSQCRVLESVGGGIAALMLTLRLSPEIGQMDRLRAHLRSALRDLPQRPGVTASHLLLTQTPEAPVTVEQRIRGGADGLADWIVLVSGYDERALMELASGELAASTLAGHGAMAEQATALFRLSCAMTPEDL